MTPDVLSYLKNRLVGIASEDCAEAVRLIEETGSSDGAVLPIRVEHDLCHAVWDCISHALDIADLSKHERLLLDAMEAEMAGRVLTARLALGELVKAA